MKLVTIREENSDCDVNVLTLNQIVVCENRRSFSKFNIKLANWNCFQSLRQPEREIFLSRIAKLNNGYSCTQDAYAEPGQDTRNIAGLEVVVIVQDVQDVPPIFTTAPPVTRLPASLLPGDKVCKKCQRNLLLQQNCLFHSIVIQSILVHTYPFEKSNFISISIRNRFCMYTPKTEIKGIRER